MRSLLGGVAAALLIVVMIPTPAYAGSGHREGVSPFDTMTEKSAKVTCPDDEVVISSGGRINAGGGLVALVAVVPSADLSSVTASGRARTGATAPWSVTATAYCATPGPARPARVSGIGSLSSATATCPAGKVLYSTGYQIYRPTGGQFVDQVVPSAELTSVQVHMGGYGLMPWSLTAFGICAAPAQNLARAEAVSVSDGAAVKSAFATKAFMRQDFGSAIYGAGIVVKGANAFIDAIGPNPSLNGAFARATRAPATGFAAMSMAADDDWHVVVYGTCIGSWY